MTMESRPALDAVDMFPYRPALIERIARHWYCCCSWRVAAGSCGQSLDEDIGITGHAASPAGEWESGSAQYIDFSTAYQRLPWLHQRIIQAVSKHGPVDQQWGDPGYYRDGKTIKGFDGLTFDDREAFWRHYQPTIGTYHWSVLAGMEQEAYEKMAQSLGWIKPAQ